MSASQPPSAASTSALSSGVASRFVSADALEQAKQKRAEEWKEAYARLGQKPPPEMTGEGEAYDPRSLFERLQENKTKKQEAFEEQLKFKNHFRALDEEEISFLDSIVDENNDEEQERKKAIQDELRAYREAVTKRSAAAPPPSLASHTLSPPVPAISPPLTSSSTASTSSPTTSVPIKKPGAGGKKRKLLPGVVVPPKKPKTAAAGKSASPTATTKVVKDTPAVLAPTKEGENEADDEKKDGAAGQKDETEATKKADLAASNPKLTELASAP